MHALSFAFKRANLTSVRLGRGLLAPFGLTPARFDLLFVLFRSHIPRRQFQLSKELGISRATVCRTVARLEQLGFVQRIRYAFDRRSHSIELTDFATSLMRRAIRTILGGGYLEVVYQCVLGSHPCERAFFLVEDLIAWVERTARELGDTSTLHYATGHPDE